jgi:hypothetical protein
MGHSTAALPRHSADSTFSIPRRATLRLLVTNPWNGQAYCVLRALRPHATRVIATTYREHGLLGRLAPAAVSRFVDGVYPVPLAVQDWQRGQIHDENSAAEEEYVRAVLDICAREDIDTVFPSWDPEVGILSKNKRASPRGASRCRFRNGPSCGRRWTSTPWPSSPRRSGARAHARTSAHPRGCEGRGRAGRVFPLC